MIPRLVIGSKNPDKVAEMETLLEGMGLAAEVVGGLTWEDVDEHGSTLEENAAIKARAVCESTGLPTLADDTGLEVDALGGAPGVETARYAGPEATYRENVDKLLREMRGADERGARFRTVVALVFPDGTEMSAEGALEGEIAAGPRGESGFGYDPVFEVEGRTLAEMSSPEKNTLSHRARAIEALGELLGL